MINLKTTENSIKLLTKDKFCNDDINVTFEGGSGGGGIEEVTELPVASAENVGKIYRYEGQLYECKEIVDLAFNNDGLIVSTINMHFAMPPIYHIVDAEPNINEMEMVDFESGIFPLYILNNGTNGWLVADEGEGAIKASLLELGLQLNGTLDNYVIPNDGQNYLVHFYDNEPISSDYLVNLTRINITETTNKTLILPKRVHSLTFLEMFYYNVITCKGNINFLYGEGSLTSVRVLDFSNNTIVPILQSKFGDTDYLQEIKVPSALLEEWKTATNWSEYADKIVGV